MKVPSDFSSTVFFKLGHFEKEIQASKQDISKSPAFWIVAAIIIIAATFAGIRYFAKKAPPKPEPAPIVTQEVFVERKDPGDKKAQEMLDELKKIATSLEQPAKKEEPADTVNTTDIPDNTTAVTAAPAPVNTTDNKK